MSDPAEGDKVRQVKFRTSYPKELKQAAKAAGKGTFTVSVHLPDGTVHEVQGSADATEARFLRWAAAMVSNRDDRPLPDLERFVREHLNKENFSG